MASHSTIRRTGQFTLFFARCTFSQHTACTMTVDDLEFHSALHYMLYEKAKLLTNSELAASILHSVQYRELIKLADHLPVSDADEEYWRSACTDVIKKGNLAKFTQREDFKNELLATAGTTLVNADPGDSLLGIGMNMNDRDVCDKERWRGGNILGSVLTEIRNEFLSRITWKVGDRCLAVWSKNFMLYDAKIVEADESRNAYKVSYERYDEEEERPSEALCPVTVRRSSRDDRYHRDRDRPRHQRREGSWQRRSHRDTLNDSSASVSHADSDADDLERFTFFWNQESPFSQWYSCRFTVDGVEYNCAEQYMMYQKALTFEDYETAYEVMAAKRPSHQKQLGRQVRNYDQDQWNAVCKDIVKKGNIAKFSQNRYLKSKLLDTAGTVLAEASPYDTKWGIGLARDDPRAQQRHLWRGTNYLGEILTQVRDEMIADGDHGTDAMDESRLDDPDPEEGYTLFWRSQSPFSQWHSAYFTVGDITYNCAEQYMMHQKAVYFGDSDMAETILKERDPRNQKSLARNVKNFDEAEWNKVSQSVVKQGSLEKYRQNAALRRELFATANSTLVEASKDDTRWGIGSTKDDRMSWRRQTWRGYNWLGKILTETRDTLMKEFPEECELECSRYREHAGISYRSFSRLESPFHMFYPANITLSGMRFTSAGQYMLYQQAQLLGNRDLTREIMETEEQEKLFTLWQKITLPDDLMVQWFDGLKRILHESNSAKFGSSVELRLKLVNTGSDTLVFAAEERPLGIDYTRHILDFSRTGWDDDENWLGTILMSVRDKLVPSIKSSQLIPGLAVNMDSGRRTSTQPMTLNAQLTGAVDRKPGRSSSDRRQSARQSSADHQGRSDVIFTDDSSEFHLWHRVELQIGRGVYESAGHYLVTKSLEMLPEGIDRADVIQKATASQDVCYVLRAFSVDAKTWRRWLQDDLLDDANDAKFGRCVELRQLLLDTGDARIVYVNDSDSFLGSGCDAEALSASNTFNGKNWLGKSLMKLRKKLQEDQSSSLRGDKSTQKHGSDESPLSASRKKKKKRR